MLVLDDHEIFREGLRTVVESRNDARVVGEAGTVREAFALLQTLAFDLAIVDLTLPGMPGIALIRELRRRELSQRVLVLTMHADAADAADAFAAGADGFALKSDSRAALWAAIDHVMRGERFVTASLPPGIVEHFLSGSKGGEATGPMGVLSDREREIADMLIRGYDNRAIAQELCISPKTVETHRTHVFSKLRVHTLADLVRLGLRHRPHDVAPSAASSENAADATLRRDR